MGHQWVLFMLILVSFTQKCQSWSWFSSSSSSSSSSSNTNSKGEDESIYGNSIVEFSMDVGVNNPKGLMLVENAKNKLVGSNLCWQNAYRHLLSGCSDIIATDEKRSRFAWHLSDCFQKDSGRAPFPFCDPNNGMVNCLKKIDNHEHKVYLEFLLETNTICYQLQSHAFKHETERLVNELKNSARYTQDKLETLEEKSDTLLRSSSELHDSLSSVDVRVQSVAKTTHNLEENVDGLMQHTLEVYQQAKYIAATQLELRQGQENMNEKLSEGMEMLKDASDNLGREIDHLRLETGEIEKDINKLGDAMSSSMHDLQKKADDIGSITGVSLDKQKELLDGQSVAMEGLRFLTDFQSEALQESRKTLQHLTDFSQKQQEELLKRQEQLQQVHDHLVQNSETILAAQREFESKQASMFVALDKLFALHNAMLLESRFIKAFFIYFISIFIIYMFTSTKQTYTVRPRLYVGLCITFLIEVAILRVKTDELERQTWIISVVRSVSLLLALLQLVHAIFTYRDYERLNHNILLTLMEKVNNMQSNKELLEDIDMDSDLNWSSWIDTDLPEDLGYLEDPDYRIPEEVGESSITTSSNSRTYNLRQRSLKAF